MSANSPLRRSVAVNGVELAVWEWPGDGPPLLFCHATGFHARCWDQVVARLSGLHVFAADFRGHGASSKPQPPYSWKNIGQDIADLASALQLSRAIGVGHSMGGHAVVLAAARVPEAFSRLVLLDPVIFAETAYIGPRNDKHYAARRRNRWTSADEMYDRFVNRPPFASWDRAVLRDYCRYGLTPAPGGDGFVLACPPAIEASIYAQSSAPDANIYKEIGTIRIPVRIVRSARAAEPGGTDMMASPTVPDLASRFLRGEDIVDRQHGHLLPMEAPDLVLGWIK